MVSQMVLVLRSSLLLVGLVCALLVGDGCRKKTAGHVSSGGSGGGAEGGGSAGGPTSGGEAGGPGTGGIAGAGSGGSDGGLMSAGGVAGSSSGGTAGSVSPVEAGVVDAPLPDLQPGATPNTLFLVDTSKGFEIGALAVDETHVYWGGYGGRLMRRALDGSGAEEQLAIWQETALGGQLAVDQDYIYWLDSGQWLRAQKGGGPSESLPLEDRGGDVAADQQYAYAALIDCASVARVRHGGTTSEIIYPAKPVQRSPGLTYLTLDGSDIYCAGGQYVFVSHNWGPLEEIISSGNELNGAAVVNGELYWLERAADGSGTNLFHRAADGQIALVATEDLFRPTRPIADSERRRLLLANGGGAYGLSADSGELKIVVPQNIFNGYQATRDKSFFYWGRYTMKYSSIERMPISQQ